MVLRGQGNPLPMSSRKHSPTQLFRSHKIRSGGIDGRRGFEVAGVGFFGNSLGRGVARLVIGPLSGDGDSVNALRVIMRIAPGLIDGAMVFHRIHQTAPAILDGLAGLTVGNSPCGDEKTPRNRGRQKHPDPSCGKQIHAGLTHAMVSPIVPVPAYRSSSKIPPKNRANPAKRPAKNGNLPCRMQNPCSR